MHSWNNDIEKYRKGQLTPAEMNALEKKALSDPFLADALEGAEQISGEDFSIDVAELNKKIIGKKKVFEWTPLRIAASIFLIVGVSITLYYVSSSNQQPELLTLQTEKTAADSNSIVKGNSATTEDSSIINNKNLLTLNEPDQKQAKEKPKKEEPSITKPSIENQQPSLTTESANDMTAGRKTDEVVVPETKAEAEVVQAEKLTELAKEEKVVAEIQSQDALRDVASDKKDSRKIKVAPSLTSGAATKSEQQSITTITGQVTSNEDSTPLPGVNVVIKGTAVGTITDNQGNYSIEVPDDKKQQLAFSYIGYQTKDVPATQSSINTKLDIDVSQLSEVVVVGYGSEDDSPTDEFNATVLLAEPTGGKRAYKKYLETKLQYPQQALQNKVEGRVTIQFTVTSEGAMDGFKVIKGIGSGCDEEVIRLIKDGPKWSPARKGEIAVDSRMRVRMRFKLPNSSR